MNDSLRIVLLACVSRFDTMHLSIRLCVFYGINSQNIMNIKSGKYPQVQLNIATTKLIQWETAEKPENKAFRGFFGFVFSLFEPFFC